MAKEKPIIFPKGIPTKKIVEIKPYQKNARTHSEYQIEKLIASIRTFGFTNPVIVDEENILIAGHGRVEAAKKIGLEEVPTITLSHLTPTEKKALVLADNRIAEDAGWDMEMVKAELTSIHATGFEIALTGFTLDDLQNDDDFDPGSEGDQGNIGKLENETTCPECGHHFKPKYE